MSATPSSALARARDEHTDPTRSWAGYCLMFTRTCLGIPAVHPDADAAWNSAEKRHSTGTPPAGAPVFWAVGEHGHVALSDGKGNVWSNDILRRGRIDLVAISTITNRWNARYRGWAEDLNGHDVSFPKVNLTIAVDAIRRAAAGQPVTDTYLADCRQFLAWARKRRIISVDTERRWLTTRAAAVMVGAIKAVQRADDLPVTGSFNAATARTMKRFGYTPIGTEGKAL